MPRRLLPLDYAATAAALDCAATPFFVLGRSLILLACMPAFLTRLCACWFPACQRASLPVCMRACAPVCLLACLHACSRAYVRVCQLTCLRVCSRAYVRVCRLTCLLACSRAYVRVYVRMSAYLFACLFACGMRVYVSLPVCVRVFKTTSYTYVLRDFSRHCSRTNCSGTVRVFMCAD